MIAALIMFGFSLREFILAAAIFLRWWRGSSMGRLHEALRTASALISAACER